MVSFVGVGARSSCNFVQTTTIVFRTRRVLPIRARRRNSTSTVALAKPVAPGTDDPNSWVPLALPVPPVRKTERHPTPTAGPEAADFKTIGWYSDLMIRMAATLCFSLTLLCPIFCLAEVGGDCSDHGQSNGRNCEAMSVGAVVVKSVIGTTPLCQLLPSMDQLLPTESPVVGSPRWLQLVAWNRANTKPPPASTRQALLQTFLF
jgi:hypothetical protein